MRKNILQSYARLIVQEARPLAGTRVSEKIAGILSLMKRRGDAHLFPRLLDQVDAEWNLLFPQEHVSVSAARHANDWAEKIARLLQMSVRDIEVKEDAGLLSGVVVRQGDAVTDASGAGAFEKLSRALNS